MSNLPEIPPKHIVRRLQLRLIGVVVGCAVWCLAILTFAVVTASDSEAAPSTKVVATLSIPSIGVRGAPVLAVGAPRGVMAVPKKVSQVGWFKESAPLTSTKGSSMLAGHVDDEKGKAGALNRLARIKRGAQITVKAKGKTWVYKVVKKKYADREKGLPEPAWTRYGKRVLTLITCANKKVTPNGYYHYEDNVVVTAVLVKGPKS